MPLRTEEEIKLLLASTAFDKTGNAYHTAGLLAWVLGEADEDLDTIVKLMRSQLSPPVDGGN